MFSGRIRPTAVGTGLGVILLGTSLVLFWLFADGGGPVASLAAEAIVVTPTTTTTVAPTTTTTTSSTTTTTVAPTTTTMGEPVDPSVFSTETKTAPAAGSPGSALTNVRTGFHDSLSRIVFDFIGDGTPAYEVGYEIGPTFIGSEGGDPITPAGPAYLLVRINPGLTFDVDDSSPTYLGPLSWDPDFRPFTEVAFVGDFEADMIWVIGLTDEHDFRVETRVNPQRLVIDIKN